MSGFRGADDVGADQCPSYARLLLGFREEPRPAGAKRLVGQAGLLRIRVGDWRILYEVQEREVVVLVVRIGPHGEV